MHPGVYCVGHRQLTDNGRRLAAVLACGPGALLSHRSAAAHFGITAAEPSRRDVDRALDAAERLGRFDLAAAERLLERTPGHRGRGRFARALRDHRPGPTRSELERRFLKVCRRAGLSHPQVNTRVAGIEVDAVWRRQRLVVELDGHAYHRTPLAFEGDRRRDAVLQLRGYRVLRITYRRLHDEPEEVVRIVRELLSWSPERPGGARGAGARAPRAGPAS